MTAESVSSGSSKSLQLKHEKGRLSQVEIDRMIADAEKFKQLDLEKKVKIEALNALEALINKMKNNQRVSQADKQKLANASEHISDM